MADFRLLLASVHCLWIGYPGSAHGTSICTREKRKNKVSSHNSETCHGINNGEFQDPSKLMNEKYVPENCL